MEKQQDDALMKARSYRSTLAAGLRLYTSSFRSLFKASWLMALLYAVVYGVLGTLASLKMSQAGLPFTYLIGGIWAILLLCFTTQWMATSTVLNKLKEHKDTGHVVAPLRWLTFSRQLMGRTLKGAFATVLVMLVPMVLMVGIWGVLEQMNPQAFLAHLRTALALAWLYTLVILLLSLPLFHVFMKYVMEAPCGYWQTLQANYGKGLQHWGSLFVVCFVSILLILAVSAVVTLPALILGFANHAALYGQLFGDPSGMPSYMPALTCATLTVTTFIQFYVGLLLLVQLYYAYGSIETKESERKQLSLDLP